MAMTTAGVGLQLQLGNSDFLKGLERAKAAAKSLKTDLAAIKAPPMPDIGKQIGLQKKQKFENPFGREWEMGLKRGTEKLRIELDRQAALYQQANRRMLPAMNRVQLSGSRVGGNPWMGGVRGGGGMGQRMANGGYSLGVGYNVGQDLAQGGLPAIANQVPQIVDVMQKSKTAKNIGLGAISAGSLYAAYELYKSGKEDVFGNDAVVSKNQAVNQTRAYNERGRKLSGFGASQGIQMGEAQMEELRIAELRREDQRRQMEAEDQELQLQSELRSARIAAIEDPLAQARAAAGEEKRILTEQYDLLVKRAKAEYEAAAANQTDSDNRIKGLEDQLKALKDIGELSEQQKIDKARLESLLPFARMQQDMAKGRSEEAIAANRAAAGMSGAVGSQGKLIDARLQTETAQISREKGKKLLDTIFDGAQRGLEALGRIAEEAARQKAQAKTRGRMEQELELAELNAGGKTRKARKLERQMNIDSARDKYKEAGYSDADAAAMAEREVVAGEGRGGRIKGAVSKNREKGGSGLDYFDGKKMKGAETSNLDAYRAVPSLRERQKKQAPVQEAPEVTSPVGKGDNAVITLLQDIANSIKAALGVSPAAEQRAGRSIKGATSPNY